MQWVVPRYTGARLRDVLREAGVRDSAVYLAYHAEDLTLNREPGKAPISRGFLLRRPWTHTRFWPGK